MVATKPAAKSARTRNRAVSPTATPADHWVVAEMLELVAAIREAEARASAQRAAGREPDLTAAVGVVLLNRESFDGHLVTGQPIGPGRDGWVGVREYLPALDPATRLESLALSGHVYFYRVKDVAALSPVDALLNLAMRLTNTQD